jgi:thymidylate synthase
MIEKAPDANSAWVSLIRSIVERGEECRPRGLRIKEILCNTTVVDMERPVVSVRARKMGYRFMAAEAWWILTGRNDVASIAPYSPHIASFSNDRYRFDGAYGPKIVDQLRYVVDSLVEDPDTRQAVISIWRPNPRPSRDIACTLTVQFLIRDGRLHCIDSMRSSDAYLGWVYDVFNFAMLSVYVLLMLRYRTGKAIKLGNLYLTAGSSHLYVDPKTDGNDHIPYSIKNVTDITTKYYAPDCAALDERQVPYTPLNVDEFDSPEHLIRVLSELKDNRSPHNFLAEFRK